MKHVCLAAVSLAALAVLVVGFGAREAEGAASSTQAKIALHLATPPAKSTQTFICQTASPVTLNTPCTSYVIDGALNTDYSMYLVVGQISPTDTLEALAGGIRGITLGIQYAGGTSGIKINSWTTCADLEFPNGSPQWPASAGGNVMTWVDCQGTNIDPDGKHIVVGAFSIYAYGADVFQITDNKNLANPALELADCNGATFNVDPLHAGFIRFGGGSSCNPCLTPCIVPVTPTTWGKIKSQYH